MSAATYNHLKWLLQIKTDFKGPNVQLRITNDIE